MSPRDKEFKTLILGGEDIEELIEKKGINRFMDTAIDLVEESFIKFTNKEVENPQRKGLYFKKGLIEFMPAKLKNSAACLKVVSYYPKNSEYSLPSVIGTMILLDAETSFPLVIADATMLTNIRTGAASGVATKHLARKNSENLGIIGTGAQAITQLHAISRVLKLKEVYANDMEKKRAKRFAKFIEEYFNLPVNVCGKKELAENSDVLVTTTSTKRVEPPVVEYSWLKKGAHINAVGSDDPGKTELDINLIRNAKIFPDFYKQARDAGECQGLLGSEISAELGEVITGKKQGRENDKEITVFDSTGTAFEDLFVFNEIAKMAEKEGVGEKKNIISTPKDPYNLYSIFSEK